MDLEKTPVPLRLALALAFPFLATGLCVVLANRLGVFDSRNYDAQPHPVDSVAGSSDNITERTAGEFTSHSEVSDLYVEQEVGAASNQQGTPQESSPSIDAQARVLLSELDRVALNDPDMVGWAESLVHAQSVYGALETFRGISASEMLELMEAAGPTDADALAVTLREMADGGIPLSFLVDDYSLSELQGAIESHPDETLRVATLRARSNALTRMGQGTPSGTNAELLRHAREIQTAEYQEAWTDFISVLETDLPGLVLLRVFCELRSNP